MRTDTEEIIFKMLEAKGGSTIVLHKTKSKRERYSEELKEVADKFTRSLYLKAIKKI